MRATITDKDDASGRWLYAWEQVAADYTSGDDIDPGAKRTGALDNSPAVEINDAEVDVGTVVHLRERGYVGGQMWYEFSHPAGGGATDPTFYSYVSASPASVSTTGMTRSTVIYEVPRAHYWVTAVVTIAFSGGAGSAVLYLGRCNHGAAPNPVKVQVNASRSDGTSGQFIVVTLSQQMRTGDWDDDGSTGTVDLSVYIKNTVGSGTVISGVQQLTALKIA